MQVLLNSVHAKVTSKDLYHTACSSVDIKVQTKEYYCGCYFLISIIIVHSKLKLHFAGCQMLRDIPFQLKSRIFCSIVVNMIFT